MTGGWMKQTTKACVYLCTKPACSTHVPQNLKYNFFKWKKKRDSSLTHFMRSASSWYQNLVETQQKKKISVQHPWWTLMWKSSVKYWQNNPTAHQKAYSPLSSWLHHWDARLIQCTQINKRNSSHKQNQRQEPNDYLNKCRKGLW